LQIDGDSFEIPADPVLAIGIHPRRTAKLSEWLATTIAEARDRHLVPSGWASDYTHTAWPSLLPKLLIHIASGDIDFFELDDLRRAPWTQLFDVPLPLLDTSRRIYAIAATGLKRPTIRRRRLGLPHRPDGIKPWTIRLIVPTHNAQALADELSGACKQAQQPAIDTGRTFGKQQGLTGPALDYFARSYGWAESTCGRIAHLRQQDDHLVVDLRLYLGDHPIDEQQNDDPDAATLEADRDRPWRQTPALRHFMRSDASISVYTTSTATAALSVYFNRSQLPFTSLTSPSFEFEDITADVTLRDGRTLQADVLQTYTDRGRRVEQAGVIETDLRRPTVPARFAGGSRAWHVDSAASATRAPPWFRRSPFESPDALGRSRAARLLEQPLAQPVTTLHLLTAYPTATLTYLRDELTRRPQRRQPDGAEFLQTPRALRFALGQSAPDTPANPGDVVAAAHVQTSAGTKLLPNELDVSLFNRDSGAMPLHHRATTRDGADAVDHLLAVNAPIDILFGQSTPLPRQTSLDLDLDAIGETFFYPPPEDADALSDIESDYIRKRVRRARRTRRTMRQLLTQLEAARYTSQRHDAIRLTQLRLGPDELHPVDAPSHTKPPLDPEPSPDCIHTLSRLVANADDDELLERIPDRWRPDDIRATIDAPNQSQRSINRLKQVERVFDKIRQSCPPLDDNPRADLELLRADLYRQMANSTLAGWRTDDAATFLQSRCDTLGDTNCPSARNYRHLAPPAARHLHAESDRDFLPAVAGRLGISNGLGEPIDWHELRTRLSVIDGHPALASDRLRTPHHTYGDPIATLFDTRQSVGRRELSDELPAVRLFADRGLPAGHLDTLLRHFELYQFDKHEDYYAGPYNVLVALHVRRASTSHPTPVAAHPGWQLLNGHTAPGPATELVISPAGFEVRIDDRSLDSVDGCPDDGPTVCLNANTEAVRRHLDKHTTLFRNPDQHDRARRRLTQIRRHFSTEALDRALQRAHQTADGDRATTLQIVADSRIPLTVLTDVISQASFETTERNGRHLVTDRHFSRFFLKTPDAEQTAPN
jgi:hypothetical protein